MKIQSDLLREILSKFPNAPPECGGVIGGKKGVITAFCFDDNDSSTEAAIYIPNVIRLNKVIEEWHIQGIDFCGLIHSHPTNEYNLSTGDIIYIKSIMSSFSIGQSLYFPIVVEHKIVAFVAIKSRNDIIIQQDDIIEIKTTEIII